LAAKFALKIGGHCDELFIHNFYSQIWPPNRGRRSVYRK